MNTIKVWLFMGSLTILLVLLGNAIGGQSGALLFFIIAMAINEHYSRRPGRSCDHDVQCKNAFLEQLALALNSLEMVNHASIETSLKGDNK